MFLDLPESFYDVRSLILRRNHNAFGFFFFFYRGGMGNQGKILNQNRWCGLVSFSKAELKLLQIMVRSDSSPTAVSAYTHPCLSGTHLFKQRELMNCLCRSLSPVVSACMYSLWATVCVVCSGFWNWVLWLSVCECTLVKSKGKKDNARISFTENMDIKKILST